MGNLMSYLPNLSNIPSTFNSGSKRKHEIINDEESIYCDSVLHVSKKHKLDSTIDYIYRALFEEGRDSDVTVCALGREWKLHKVYLCQSPYFLSMFSGNWKEASCSYITIEILDETITVEALNTMFGIFYRNDLEIEAAQVIPLLASAMLLQMDCIINHCIPIMIETINIHTVLKYYNASQRYGLIEVDKHCRKWLLHNFLAQMARQTEVLKDIPIELMHDLLSSKDLFVVQTEISIYAMLKVWIFLRQFPELTGRYDSVYAQAHNFFRSRKDPRCFIESEGNAYYDIFNKVRLEHMISHHYDVEMIYKDRIIPKSRIRSVSSKQWYSMLLVEQEKEIGPTNISEEEFNNNCARCGRILNNGGKHIWRWTGFNFGLDLVMFHNEHLISLKRNHKTENIENVGGARSRNILYRITAASTNEQKQVIYSKTTGLQSISLTKNQEMHVMTLDPTVKYPLLLSVNFLVVTPPKNEFLNNSRESSDAEDDDIDDI